MMYVLMVLPLVLYTLSGLNKMSATLQCGCLSTSAETCALEANEHKRTAYGQPNNYAEHVDPVRVSLQTSNHVDRNASETDCYSAAHLNSSSFVKREISLLF